MPYKPEHRRATRERILHSARKLFNRKGFAEVTIDAIMAEAGLTRGGFYRHFATKEELYSEVLLQFTCRSPPEKWQRKHVDPCAQGVALARMLVDAYLSREHFQDRDGSCPTVALPSDVSRSNAAVKRAFAKVLDMLVSVFVANLRGRDAREHGSRVGVRRRNGGGQSGRRSGSRRRIPQGRPQARAGQLRLW